MSACIYYRKGRCANVSKCQYKILARNGERLCQKEGDIPNVDKPIKSYKKIEE